MGSDLSESRLTHAASAIAPSLRSVACSWPGDGLAPPLYARLGAVALLILAGDKTLVDHGRIELRSALLAKQARNLYYSPNSIYSSRVYQHSHVASLPMHRIKVVSGEEVSKPFNLHCPLKFCCSGFSCASGRVYSIGVTYDASF